MTNQRAVSALVTEFMGSPEAKFFMVKFLSRLPDGSGRIDDLSGFSRRLGFTKPTTTRCVSELVELGLLFDERHQRGQKPYRILTLSPKLQELTSTKGSSPVHHQHIEQLLVWGEEPLPKRRHKLTINKRLVLLFLLAHADQAGIVRGVSVSALSRCTGLNNKQVKNNIRLLTQHQYISSSIPGGNFHGTMGKASSIYNLNLRHPGYGKDQLPGITLLFTSENGFANNLHEAAQLSSDVGYILRQTRNFTNQEADEVVLNGIDARDFTLYIKGRLSSAMQQRLQWELQDIASRVISSRLESSKESFRLIESEVSARVFADIGEDTPSKDDILAQGLTIFSHLVKLITERTRKLLDELKNTPEDMAFCQILPMQRGNRSNAAFAVEVGSTRTSEEEKRNVRTILFDFNTCKILAQNLYTTLDDIPTDRLHAWGILTKPIKQPELRVPPARYGSLSIDKDVTL